MDFQFTFDTSEGAVLLLPDGGSRENLLNTHVFLQQALAHGLKWYEYAKIDRGRMIENGSLYLITGCDKSISWGIASFSDSTRGNNLSLKFTAPQIAAENPSRLVSWVSSSSSAVRYGPTIQHPVRVQYGEQQRHLEPSTPLQNQCVLVRGFRISIRPLVLAQLLGPLQLALIQDQNKDLGSSISNLQSGTLSWLWRILGQRGTGSQHSQSSEAYDADGVGISSTTAESFPSSYEV